MIIIASQEHKINAVTLLHYKIKTVKIRRVNPQYGLVVKGLSRLPVTEEIAGSNPVEPAKLNSSPSGGLFNLPVRLDLCRR